MLSDKELIDAYVLGGAGVPGIRAVAAEVARKTLEDVIERVLGPSDRLRDVGTCRDIAEELRDVIRAASISTDKAGDNE